MCSTDPDGPAWNRTSADHEPFDKDIDGIKNQRVRRSGATHSKSADLRVLGVRLPLPAPCILFERHYLKDPPD